MRVGILGGAFNPPHIGHVVCAMEALFQLDLERVVLVPVGAAPHRELEGDPGAETRFELAGLAIAGDRRLAVSRLELDREGPSYTVDTLRELRARWPDDERFLILGGDQAAAMAAVWQEPEEVLSLAAPAVCERVGFSRHAIASALAGLEGAERVRFLDMPLLEISSSEIRRRVSTGRSIRYLVPEAVASYIGAKGLYGTAAPAGASV